MNGSSIDPATLSPFHLATLLRHGTEGESAESTAVDGAPADPAGCLQGVLYLALYLADLEPSDEARAEILDSILLAVGGERAFLIRYDEEHDAPWSILSSRSCEREEVLNPLDKIIVPLVEPCRLRGSGYLTLDLEQEEVFAALARDRQPRTKSLLILPFPDSRQFLYVDHRFASLTVPTDSGFELAWLFTLLVARDGTVQRETEGVRLREELAEARKELREQRSRPSAKQEVAPDAPNLPDPRGFTGEFSNIIGRTPELLEILEVIEKVGPTTAPILINGESGTGKELIAQAVHRNSNRSKNPFISENCAALTETLLESELFGYVKGAFTGANDDRPGLFELANGGTLFLDEVGDTSPTMQKKLLRALQEGVVRRVGGAELIQVDVRVISATNKDLLTEVNAGRFREDLFYRLNVINIHMPALRERRDDVPLLLSFFLAQMNEENNLAKTAPPEFTEALLAYSWPGNIRELQNEIRRAYALSDSALDVGHLSPRVIESTQGTRSHPGTLGLDEVLELGSLKEATETVEKNILVASLKRFHGNKAKICEVLKIPKTTLYAKLRRYGVGD